MAGITPREKREKPEVRLAYLTLKLKAAGQQSESLIDFDKIFNISMGARSSATRDMRQ